MVLAAHLVRLREPLRDLRIELAGIGHPQQMRVRVRVDRLDLPKPRAVDAAWQPEAHVEPTCCGSRAGKAYAHHIRDLVAIRQHLRRTAALHHLMKSIVKRANFRRLPREQSIQVVPLAGVILVAIDELVSAPRTPPERAWWCGPSGYHGTLA